MIKVLPYEFDLPLAQAIYIYEKEYTVDPRYLDFGYLE